MEGEIHDWKIHRNMAKGEGYLDMDQGNLEPQGTLQFAYVGEGFLHDHLF